MTWLLVWTALYGLLTAARLGLAAWYARRMARPSSATPTPTVTIVQPILSGDPALKSCLQNNLALNPDAHFLWLVDEDDRLGRALVFELRERHGDRTAISVIVGPGPIDGENPKMAKLIRAEPQISTDAILVLDDDTILPPGGASSLARHSSNGALATGLPLYAPHDSLTERLVAGFINGQTMATYFAMAALGANRTINGMAYAVRTATLADHGGFHTAGHEVTDDYAIARLWTAHRAPLLQTAIFCRVVISLASPLAAGRVLRRWFIFANRYLSRNMSAATFALVVLPTLLPALGAPLAIAHGWSGTAIWLTTLATKAIANSALLRYFASIPLSPIQMASEIAADLLTPFIYLSSLIRPARLTWRTRRIDMRDGTIRYR